MRVSIITVCFNSSATILRTLNSIRQQSYADIEHIIIDGGSTDETLRILRDFGHNGPLVSEKDKGIYDAMNKGIAIATGDVVGILNSDDFYANDNAIDKIVKAFKSSGSDAVYGDLLYVNNRNSNKVDRKWISGGYNDSLIYRGWMPPHPTFFVRKEVYEKFGNFNLQLRSSADYELMLRFLFLHRIYAKHIPSVLVHMQNGGQSNSSLKNRFAAHKEDYLAWTLNGLKPKWYTLILKPVRKMHQFVVFKRQIFNQKKQQAKNESKDLVSVPSN